MKNREASTDQKIVVNIKGLEATTLNEKKINYGRRERISLSSNFKDSKDQKGRWEYRRMNRPTQSLTGK